MRKTVICLVILTVLLFALGGCRSQEQSKGVAVVYVAVPLSGFQANGGQTVLGGVRLAAEQINRAGGLLGYELEVRPLDDESDSDVAVNNIEAVSAASRTPPSTVWPPLAWKPLRGTAT